MNQKTDSEVLRKIIATDKSQVSNDAEVVRKGDKNLYSLMSMGNETPLDDDLDESAEFVEEDKELRDIGGNYMSLNITGDEIEIVIDEITDTLGRYAAKVDKVFANLDTTIIPFAAAGIPDEVKEIKGYETSRIAGIRYIYTKKIREKAIQSIIKKATEAIASGNYFKQLLNFNLKLNGEQYESLLLSPEECSIIASRLRRYKGRVLVSNAGSVYFLAGGTEYGE